MSRFSNFFSRVTERVAASRYEQILGRMSDQQLAELGLRRRDILRHARELARAH